ncbi:hypothetical protein MtrunA17_Chr8g0347411 [Medicago truncatula]|uniref:Uncharacterized protein n=1 Tax=Medicago truncatula TaxID=3880 RepID=A0A396GGK8_MEDTR|nr:hypothetical protein MtrunA17_Chr8g0347411 [Medicago truncatula]
MFLIDILSRVLLCLWLFLNISLSNFILSLPHFICGGYLICV